VHFNIDYQSPAFVADIAALDKKKRHYVVYCRQAGEQRSSEDHGEAQGFEDISSSPGTL